LRGGFAPSLLNSPLQPSISVTSYQCLWLERGHRSEVSTYQPGANRITKKELKKYYQRAIANSVPSVYNYVWWFSV
jgi:hypothetical protein